MVMKQVYWFPFIVTAVVFLGTITPAIGYAQQQETTPSEASALIAVEYAAVCRDVVDCEPVDVDTSFPANIGRLYCVTKIVGAVEPTHVSHVWYYRERERARVTLDVRSASWRTYSSKSIMPRETGEWRVDIVGPRNNLLLSLPFAVTPVPEGSTAQQ
jgi:hypothetical protein